MRKFIPSIIVIVSALLMRVSGVSIGLLSTFQADIISSFTGQGPYSLLPYVLATITLFFFILSSSLVFQISRKENDFQFLIPPLSLLVFGFSLQVAVISSSLLLAYLMGKAIDSKFSKLIGLGITVSIVVLSYLVPSYYEIFINSTTTSATDFLYSKVSSVQQSLYEQMNSYVYAVKSQYIENLRNSDLPGKDELITQAEQVFQIEKPDVDRREIERVIRGALDTGPTRRWFPWINGLAAYFVVSLLTSLSKFFEDLSIREKKSEG